MCTTKTRAQCRSSLSQLILSFILKIPNKNPQTSNDITFISINSLKVKVHFIDIVIP